MVLIGQGLAAAVATPLAAKSSRADTEVVVICSVHGQMSLVLDDEGAPAPQRRQDCPWCRLGAVAGTHLMPAKLANSYDLTPLWRVAVRQRFHLEDEVPVRTIWPGRPSSPRAPPTA